MNIFGEAVGVAVGLTDKLGEGVGDTLPEGAGVGVGVCTSNNWTIFFPNPAQDGLAA